MRTSYGFQCEHSMESSGSTWFCLDWLCRTSLTRGFSYAPSQVAESWTRAPAAVFRHRLMSQAVGVESRQGGGTGGLVQVEEWRSSFCAGISVLASTKDVDGEIDRVNAPGDVQ